MPTVEQLRDELAEELVARRSSVTELEGYYDGNHPLPEPPKRLQPGAFAQALKAYQKMTAQGVTNWVKLVADAPAERLEVIGWRGVNDAAAERVWGRWNENDLDYVSPMVHDTSLQTGQAYVMVDPTSGDVTAEHPSQVIIRYEDGTGERLAALKMWTVEDGDEALVENLTLLTPNAVHRWVRTTLKRQPRRGEDRVRVERRADPDIDDEDGTGVTTHDLGEVSVVEFAANASLRPRPYGGGRSEFATVLPIQDRINKTVFDRLVAAEWQAFRQRYIIGWSPEVDDSDSGNGRRVLPVEEQLQKLQQAFTWTFENHPDDMKVGEFDAHDFTGFLAAVEADVNAMAAISKTPPHYLLAAMVNISGDALTAAESGLSSKTRRHARNFGASWVDVMRLAALVDGDTEVAEATDAAIIWEDIEHRSWGETVDALLKMQSLGVPQSELWARLPDVTPADVTRWRSRRTLDRVVGVNQDPPAEESDDAASAGAA